MIETTCILVRHNNPFVGITKELPSLLQMYVFIENAWSAYMSYGESAPGYIGDPTKEVVQDISTTFFILLAILFPTFTDIICGANLSGKWLELHRKRYKKYFQNVSYRRLERSTEFFSCWHCCCSGFNLVRLSFLRSYLRRLRGRRSAP